MAWPSPKSSLELLIRLVRMTMSVMFIADHSAGRLPVSFPTSVATTPIFYNYLKGSRPIDPGTIYPNGSLSFGHQVYVPDAHKFSVTLGIVSMSLTPLYLHGALGAG